MPRVHPKKKISLLTTQMNIIIIIFSLTHYVNVYYSIILESMPNHGWRKKNRWSEKEFLLWCGEQIMIFQTNVELFPLLMLAKNSLFLSNEWFRMTSSQVLYLNTLQNNDRRNKIYFSSFMCKKNKTSNSFLYFFFFFLMIRMWWS